MPSLCAIDVARKANRDCWALKHRSGESTANITRVHSKPKVHFAMTVKGVEAPRTITDSGAGSQMFGSRELLSGALSIAHRRVLLGDGRSVLADTSGRHWFLISHEVVRVNRLSSKMYCMCSVWTRTYLLVLKWTDKVTM